MYPCMCLCCWYPHASDNHTCCCHPWLLHRTGYAETRRSRRLVISFVMTAVNYEYVFYWYLYQVRQKHPTYGWNTYLPAYSPEHDLICMVCLARPSSLTLPSVCPA